MGPARARMNPCAKAGCFYHPSRRRSRVGPGRSATPVRAGGRACTMERVAHGVRPAEEPAMMRRLPHPVAAALLLALALAPAAGCSKKSTAPAPKGQIAGRVTHEGGASAGGLDVALISYGGASAVITL